MTACRKKSDRKETKKEEENESKRTRSTERKILRLLWSFFMREIKTEKNIHIQTNGTCTAECGEVCLLLVCSWCRGLREASGRWSARWRRQERLRLCREAAAWSYTSITYFWSCWREAKRMKFRSCRGRKKGWKTNRWEGFFFFPTPNRSVKVGVTLFIFSSTQGFPSE